MVLVRLTRCTIAGLLMVQIGSNCTINKNNIYKYIYHFFQLNIGTYRYYRYISVHLFDFGTEKNLYTDMN